MNERSETPPSPARSAADEEEQKNEAALQESMVLVVRAKQGDPTALGDLFTRYAERVRRIVRVEMTEALERRCDVDDILQEVWQVAARKIPEYELRTHAGIRRWFVQIAKNKILDQVKRETAEMRDFRREGPRITGGDESETSPGFVVAGNDPTPSVVGARREDEELVDHFLARLEPEEYRQVILLKNYYGESWESIREKLDRPSVGAVRELHRRAKDKLRDLISTRRSSLDSTA